MTNDQKTEVEAAAFRALIAHLQQRTDTQNIDLMNIAGFCRNCLAKWYSAEAKKIDSSFDLSQAQDYVYGMSYADWKDKYQTKATEEQMQTYQDTADLHAKIEGY